MRRAQFLAVVILTMSVSACGQDAPAPAPAPPAASTSVPSAAPEAAEACKLAAGTPRTGEAIEIDEQTIKSLIEYAGKSRVASIEKAGAQLKEHYSTWLDAPIGDEAATAQDRILDAAGQVREACTTAGITS